MDLEIIRNHTVLNRAFLVRHNIWFDSIYQEIFLGLIQTFDCILMIPIIILSSLPRYGLIYPWQRRREIHPSDYWRFSIPTTEYGISRGLRDEFCCLVLGYILAIQTVGLVLSAVGFMSFEPLGLINVQLGTISLLVTVSTIGAALLFGRGRTKEFLELEIDEGFVKFQPKEAAHRFASPDVRNRYFTVMSQGLRIQQVTVV